MAACLKCGGEGDYSFRVLEVHTLHVRDLDGEKRVQALGDFREYAVCCVCAQARLDRALRPERYQIREPWNKHEARVESRHVQTPEILS